MERPSRRNLFDDSEEEDEDQDEIAHITDAIHKNQNPSERKETTMERIVKKEHEDSDEFISKVEENTR
jgi:hypothetical protein